MTVQKSNSLPYAHELHIALLAAQRAVILTRSVLNLVNKGSLSKADDSPVSLADFGAQALLIAAIHTAFPDDRIIAEENGDALRARPEMMHKVFDLVRSTRLEDEASEKVLGQPESELEMVALIDIGYSGEGVGTKGRVWTIDPVDGTKTYLDGTQYCVVIALLEDGEEKLGVIACPKLDLENGKVSETDCAQDGPGWIVSAVKNQGVHVRQLSTGALLPSKAVPKRTIKEDPKDLIFVENMQTATPRFPQRNLFAEPIGAKWPPVDLYSSSITYAALALGLVDYQIRAPVPSPYYSYVWDHAGGILIFEEAGGKVSDLRGNPIVLSTESRELNQNYGNIGADVGIHSKLVKLVKDVFEPYSDFAEALAELPPVR